MSRVIVLFREASGGPEIVEHLIANDDAIAAVVNGDLEAEVNVSVSAPTAAQRGASQSEGSASTLLRSDAQFIIQGFEALSTEPTSAHFLGRVYYDTSDDQLKRCTNESAGTYTPFDNLGVAEVATHGSSHSQGATDPLANGAVSSAMMGRSAATKLLGADVPNVKQAWLNVVTMDQVTLATGQAVTFSGKILCHNVTGSDTRAAWQIIDTDNANAIVASTYGFPCASAQTAGMPVSDIIQAAAGTHTYKLQVAQQGSASNGFDVNKDSTTTIDGTTFHTFMTMLVG